MVPPTLAADLYSIARRWLGATSQATQLRLISDTAAGLGESWPECERDHDEVVSLTQGTRIRKRRCMMKSDSTQLGLCIADLVLLAMAGRDSIDRALTGKAIAHHAFPVGFPPTRHLVRLSVDDRSVASGRIWNRLKPLSKELQRFVVLKRTAVQARLGQHLHRLADQWSWFDTKRLDYGPAAEWRTQVGEIFVLAEMVNPTHPHLEIVPEGTCSVEDQGQIGEPNRRSKLTDRPVLDQAHPVLVF